MSLLCLTNVSGFTYGPSDHVKTCLNPQLLTALSSSRAEELILYDPVGAIIASRSAISVYCVLNGNSEVVLVTVGSMVDYILSLLETL